MKKLFLLSVVIMVLGASACQAGGLRGFLFGEDARSIQLWNGPGSSAVAIPLDPKTLDEWTVPLKDGLPYVFDGNTVALSKSKTDDGWTAPILVCRMDVGLGGKKLQRMTVCLQSAEIQGDNLVDPPPSGDDQELWLKKEIRLARERWAGIDPKCHRERREQIKDLRHFAAFATRKAPFFTVVDLSLLFRGPSSIEWAIEAGDRTGTSSVSFRLVEPIVTEAVQKASDACVNPSATVPATAPTVSPNNQLDSGERLKAYAAQVGMSDDVWQSHLNYAIQTAGIPFVAAVTDGKGKLLANADIIVVIDNGRGRFPIRSHDRDGVVCVSGLKGGEKLTVTVDGQTAPGEYRATNGQGTWLIIVKECER